jgi:CheY-like chemotaxis protein
MTQRKRGRILVADDVPDSADVLCHMLTGQGYETHCAYDGEQCLALAREFHPQLLILDIMMPKVHGMDVLRSLSSDPATRTIKVMVCSARGFQPDFDQARALGAIDFIVKPVDYEQLIARVKTFFASVPEDFSETKTLDRPVGAAEPYLPEIDTSKGYWRLWGTRGSITVSGPQTARHGGNTACFEISDGKEQIIIDAGTGIRDLGMELVRSQRRNLTLLIGHTHWDHIQGFPFFAPAYVPGFSIDVYGASGFGKDLRSIFQGQLDRDYFPVEMKDMAAALNFKTLQDPPLRVGSIEVYWEFMNHPGATVGFRFHVAGQKIAYVTDNEFLKGYLGRPHDIAEGSELLEPYKKIIDLVRGVDVLIHEAQYTHDEYPKKTGWGHSSIGNACLIAHLSGARRWIITHHDPSHTDDMLDRKLHLTRQILRTLGSDIDVSHAYDGMAAYFA